MSRGKNCRVDTKSVLQILTHKVVHVVNLLCASVCHVVIMCCNLVKSSNSNVMSQLLI